MAYETREALLFKINLTFLIPMIIYLVSLYERNEYLNMIILTSIPMFILIVHKYLLSGIKDLSPLHIPASLIIIVGLILTIIQTKSGKDALRNPDESTKTRSTSGAIYGSMILLTLILMSGVSLFEMDTFGLYY